MMNVENPKRMANRVRQIRALGLACDVDPATGCGTDSRVYHPQVPFFVADLSATDSEHFLSEVINQALLQGRKNGRNSLRMELHSLLHHED